MYVCTYMCHLTGSDTWEVSELTVYKCHSACTSTYLGILSHWQTAETLHWI